MNEYRKILVAIDLTDESPAVLDKAVAIARRGGAELHIVHVMQPIAVGYAAEVMSIDIAGLNEEAIRHARDALFALGNRLDIPATRLHNVMGQAAREIRFLARELAADLVVIGGHGKHGFELLLGSTASGVTHGINCDLLIVHLE